MLDPIIVRLGDMVARYELDDASGAVGLMLLPASGPRPSTRDRPQPTGLGGQAAIQAAAPTGRRVESLLQVRLTGDVSDGRRSQGRTLRNSSTTLALQLAGHAVRETPEGIISETKLTAAGKLSASHILSWRPGDEAIEAQVQVTNIAPRPVTLELLTSFCLTGISPFACADTPGNLVVHRLRSGWCSEAHLVSEPAEHLHLEPDCYADGVNVERFGQVGTMPVLGFAPCVAVEDRAAGITWAAQLCWGGSWQIELYRRTRELSIAGGLADRDFGHWRKALAPAETFDAPPAWLTVALADAESCIQRLVAMQAHATRQPGGPAAIPELPVVANECATTDGHPSHETAVAMAGRLAGSGVKYLVIDAGWYQCPSGSWFDSHGDWLVNQSTFPQGLGATAAAIRSRGLVPGLWAELETCGSRSSAFSLTDHLLHRDGIPITAGERHFWDFRDPFTRRYLTDRILKLLEDAGFGYLKIDYNETAGVGCDGAESPGEGLRQQVKAAHDFIAEIRRRMPGLVIENCASGGHRLEPSLMALCDLGSFSDASECPELPVIAASTGLLIPAWRSLIWVVLRRSDTKSEQTYKLASGFLGRPCLSGDLANLDDAQWDLARRALNLYARAQSAMLGRWQRYGTPGHGYRALTGWQGVVRVAPSGNGALVVCHAFGGTVDGRDVLSVELPRPGGWVLDETLSCGEPLQVDGNVLSWEPHAPFSAVVAWLVRPSEAWSLAKLGH
jgi:alpha-galactosidase